MQVVNTRELIAAMRRHLDRQGQKGSSASSDGKASSTGSASADFVKYGAVVLGNMAAAGRQASEVDKEGCVELLLLALQTFPVDAGAQCGIAVLRRFNRCLRRELSCALLACSGSVLEVSAPLTVRVARPAAAWFASHRAG